MMPKPIHEQVREAREAAGLLQSELAQLCGFEGQPAVARLEAGTHSPKVATLQRVADALRVDLVIGWDRGASGVQYASNAIRKPSRNTRKRSSV